MSSHVAALHPDDVALAESVADRIASSIENLRLYEQQRDIARTLQRSLLPAALPDIPGIDIAVRYWPVGEANEVGGDFYDVFALDPAVTGRSSSATCAAPVPRRPRSPGLARHTIRDSAWHGDTPADVLAFARPRRQQLSAPDRSSPPSTPRSTLRSDADVDRDLRRPPACPSMSTVAVTTAVTLGSPGTLLGMLDNVEFTTETRQLNAGDVVVFHTDGATDVPPPHNLDSRAIRRTRPRAVHPARRSAKQSPTDPRSARDHPHLRSAKRRHRPARPARRRCGRAAIRAIDRRACTPDGLSSRAQRRDHRRQGRPEIGAAASRSRRTTRRRAMRTAVTSVHLVSSSG